MTTADEILDFWFGADEPATQRRWFAADPDFDRLCSERFAAAHAAAAAGALDGWQDGCLPEPRPGHSARAYSRLARGMPHAGARARSSLRCTRAMSPRSNNWSRPGSWSTRLQRSIRSCAP